MLILFAITFLSFGMMRIAGSDVVEQKMLRTGAVVSDQVVADAKAELGLDQPFLTQYVRWLDGLLHGDMGRSYVSGQDVMTTLLSKLPATLLLAVVSLLMTIGLSIPLGIISAVYKNSIWDHLIGVCSFIGNSMPNFFVALLLMYFFSIRLGLFPVISRNDNLESVILPGATLAIAMSAKYVRQVRSTVLEELYKDYVMGAVARGLHTRTILWQQVLPACCTPLLTLLAMSFGSLLGGTAVVESIFMWDGMGKLAVDAITMRDYPMIQAYVMWMAILYVVLHLFVDLSYHFLDPRIRLQEVKS